MVNEEIFINPTVKEVDFEIRFPNLFYIENKIGELQLKIMNEFPNSSLVFRAPIAFANVGAKGEYSLPPGFQEEAGNKIWEFESEKDYELKISSNSLIISSKHHKTYNLGNDDKFRDLIEFVLENFFEVMPITIINRIGLRYIDECPLPSKDNETFNCYYNSVFPIDRFNLSNTEEMDFKTLIKEGNYYLRYVESLQKIDDEYRLILDFDGSAKKIKTDKYLEVTDALHELIEKEYFETIKQPVKDFMRELKER